MRFLPIFLLGLLAAPATALAAEEGGAGGTDYTTKAMIGLCIVLMVAASVIGASDPGGLADLPDMLVRWMAVGPVARDRIGLLTPVERTVHGVAEAFGRNVSDVTALVLNRPRHEDLIEEIRSAGARIKL